MTIVAVVGFFLEKKKTLSVALVFFSCCGSLPAAGLSNAYAPDRGMIGA